MRNALDTGFLTTCFLEPGGYPGRVVGDSIDVFCGERTSSRGITSLTISISHGGSTASQTLVAPPTGGGYTHFDITTAMRTIISAIADTTATGLVWTFTVRYDDQATETHQLTQPFDDATVSGLTTDTSVPDGYVSGCEVTFRAAADLIHPDDGIGFSTYSGYDQGNNPPLSDRTCTSPDGTTMTLAQLFIDSRYATPGGSMRIGFSESSLTDADFPAKVQAFRAPRVTYWNPPDPRHNRGCGLGPCMDYPHASGDADTATIVGGRDVTVRLLWISDDIPLPHEADVQDVENHVDGISAGITVFRGHQVVARSNNKAASSVAFSGSVFDTSFGAAGSDFCIFVANSRQAASPREVVRLRIRDAATHHLYWDIELGDVLRAGLPISDADFDCARTYRYYAQGGGATLLQNDPVPEGATVYFEIAVPAFVFQTRPYICCDAEYFTTGLAGTTQNIGATWTIVDVSSTPSVTAPDDLADLLDVDLTANTFTFREAGWYNFRWTSQFDQTGSGNKDAYIQLLQVDGTTTTRRSFWDVPKVADDDHPVDVNTILGVADDNTTFRLETIMENGKSGELQMEPGIIYITKIGDPR